ncbi:ketopantoate reductase family protein [Paenibacillus ginsengarvi]|uniref:2-dehydropantoate 2-reductase n=1 Tax=Paenibacillus ginsengarvi TaxID=400777 RepID=A0A3B0CT89_9BACL|nr:2-dehydropantoate 2-reductase [Paenibacillus ginsengarvi]RKN86911.1 2-dehydropantoate 2-reductase [Paenibacillus ginsengarvi]
MNIICIGAGAIGMLVTARLALAGANVLLVTHSEEQALLLNSGGLNLLEGPTDNPVSVKAISYGQLAANGGTGQADWVLLTVKQKHITPPLLDIVSRIAGDEGHVLCFQNGIGHVERISRHVSAERIFLAVTTEGARKLGPNKVAHTGAGTTWIGPAAPKPKFLTEMGQNRQNLIVHSLRQGGFQVLPSNQMNELVWNKLLINSVINPLTALLRIRNGELPAAGERIELMRLLLNEGISVAKGLGIRVRDDVWEQVLDVCRNTANNHSSMLQDVQAGRSTEIEWINGAIVKQGYLLHIQVPVSETICRLIKAAGPSGDNHTAENELASGD